MNNLGLNWIEFNILSSGGGYTITTHKSQDSNETQQLTLMLKAWMEEGGLLYGGLLWKNMHQFPLNWASLG